MTKTSLQRAAGWGRVRQLLSISFAVALAMAFTGSAVAADMQPQARMQQADSTALNATSSQWRKNADIEVGPKIMRAFSAGPNERADLIVRFRGQADLSAAFSMGWEERGEFVFHTLKRFADRAQADTLSYLDGRVRYQQLWIANAIVLRRADMATLNALMTMPNVASIRAPLHIDLPKPANPAKPASRAQLNAVNQNLTHINVDDVWAMGYTGSGVVVGNIDSGVRYTHEALVDSYRGNLGGNSFSHDYNFFDPYQGAAVPRTTGAHGSHTMGIMVGDDGAGHQIGMAPGAEWIACVGFDPNDTSPGNGPELLSCAQFMLAPTRTDGTGANPDKRPEVVNNSWGDCQTAFDGWFESAVDAWIAAGIVPVFSNGNTSNCGYTSPPPLNTVGNPARYGKVLGVGATGNHDGQYAIFSNWGPSDNPNPGLPNYPDPMGFPNLKPNVAAPGTNILSASDSADSAYIAKSGTSMSAPHVSGLVALMEQAAPCLKGDYATLGTIIMQTATAVPYTTGWANEPASHVPNAATGWGEIDALAAVNQAMIECGPQGAIAGTVSSASSTPIEGATVFMDGVNYDFTVITAADGSYSVTVPTGAYDVIVSKYAYATTTQSGINVALGVTTTVDFSLTLLPTHTVSGVVTDSATGWPLHASVTVGNAPIDPVWTDPVTGQYSVVLPAGDHNLTAHASVAGYTDSTVTITGLAADTTQDLSLAALGTCTAPGYTLATPLLDEDFESSSLPSGWSRSSNGVGWQIGSNLGSYFFQIPAASIYAAVNDDAAGSGNDGSVDMLQLSALNLAAASSPVLRFDSYYTGGYGQLASVEASTDGTTWAPVGQVAPNAAWASQSIDLAAYAGEPNVLLRFHSDDAGGFATGWAVDNVILTPGCVSPATGGLIVGEVSDANTGDKLNGVAIATTPGSATATTAAVNDPAIGDGFYTVYAPEGSVEVTATLAPYQSGVANVSVPHLGAVAGNIALAAGQLALTPATGPEATVAFGSATSGSLGLHNSGSAVANYAFLAPLVSQDFEGALGDDGWTVTNLGGDCVWQRNDAIGMPNLAGGDGFAAVASSDACGSGTSMDTALVSPSFSLALAGSAVSPRLSFMLSFNSFSGSDYLDVDVTIDDGASWHNLAHVDADVSPEGPGQLVLLDLGQWVGASNVRVRFRYVSGWDFWAQVDQVRILTTPNAVPWFALTPDHGSLSGSASTSPGTIFDAAQVPQPGDYLTPLMLVSDTPYSPQPAMAIMHAQVPASYGTLEGSVQTLGYCDASPAPLAGATVTIVGSGGSYQTTTDASGHYSYLVDSGEAPFTVLATAPGLLQGSVAGVALAAGGSTTADIDLRLDKACLFLPQQVSLSAAAGTSVTQQLSITNLGAQQLDSWSLRIGGDASAVSAVTLAQASSTAITDNNTIACYNSSANFTRDNHWLRRFNLAAAGFVGDVTLESMTFGVQALDNASSFDVEARVYVLPAGMPFTFANLVLVGSKTVSVATADVGTLVTATFDTPLTVPGNVTLVLDLYAPDGEPSGISFFAGSNAAPEDAPSYIASSFCGIAEPTPIAALAPSVSMVLSASGSGSMACSASATPVSWLSVTPTTGGPVAADSADSVAVTADAGALASGSHGASLCYASSDAGNPAGGIPVTFSVGPSDDIIFQDGFEL